MKVFLKIGSQANIGNMNKIEKYKHLFVPVTDKLPDKQGYYLTICNNKKEEWLSLSQFIVAPNGKYWYDYLHITHWLDLDLLTTKKRAEELAGDAFEAGYYEEAPQQEGGVFIGKEAFIFQNKDRL